MRRLIIAGILAVAAVPSLVAGEPVMTLDQCIESALNANAKIIVANEKQNESEAAIRRLQRVSSQTEWFRKCFVASRCSVYALRNAPGQYRRLRHRPGIFTMCQHLLHSLFYRREGCQWLPFSRAGQMYFGGS